MRPIALSIKLVMFILLMPSLALASEIILKSGQKIEGNIVEQTDKYVKINTGVDVIVTYYNDQIDKVLGPPSLTDQNHLVNIATTGDLGIFTSYYYQKMDLTLVIPALEFFLHQDALLNYNNTRLKPTLHFFATLGHENPVILEKIKALQGNYTGMKSTLISDIIQDAEKFVSPEPKKTQDVDYLWSEFMATGDDLPVEKIIHILSNDAHGESLLVLGAAKWSLIANGVRHDRVYALIKAESLKATGQEKVRLIEILQQIEVQLGKKKVALKK